MADSTPEDIDDANPSALVDRGRPAWIARIASLGHGVVTGHYKMPFLGEAKTVAGQVTYALVGIITFVGISGSVAGGITYWVNKAENANNRTSDFRESLKALPVIAFIGPIGDPQHARGADDWKPVLDAIKPYTDPDGRLISASGLRIATFNDLGELATATSVAKEICADSRIIAVVGYMWSGVARSALAEYTKCRDPIGVILVGATAPDLTKMKLQAENVRAPILQMPLSNAYQARQIVLALGDTYSSQDTIFGLMVRSTENAEYSIPFADKIRLLSRSFKKATVNWKIVDYDDGTTWDQLVTRYVPELDIVIYIGNSTSAKLLTKGRRPGIGPLLVVTDGSVNSEFVSRGEEARCVWGTFPVAPVSETAAMITPTFAPFGVEALGVVLAWYSNLPRPDKATRDEFRRYIDNLTAKQARVSLIDGSQIAFDEMGHSMIVNDDASDAWPNYYHLMQTQFNDQHLRWKHRELRSSLRTCLPH